jgi:hypothetical protein
MAGSRFTVFSITLVVIALMGHQPATAQVNVQAGNIQGVITDPDGAVVPAAKVTIVSKDTSASVSTSATSAGTFSSGSLIPGTYIVRVEAPSFKTTEVTANVLINVVTVVNVKLELGASSTVVEVSGSTVAVNTAQAQVSGSLTTEQIENLPVNGRNFLDLAQLEPGVQIQDGGNFDPTKIGFSSISFGGRFGRSARISVDGVDVSDETVGTTTTGIPASAILEFQLAQSNLDLSNDLTSSGAVNVATKSGTNSIHGDAFGLLRDSSEAAAYPGGAQFQRYQYGGDVGGAIIKDKLFYFVAGEKLLAHDAGGVLVADPLQSFTGTYPAPFHDGSVLARFDWQATKSVHAFARFNYWQNLDVGNVGGAANYSNYANSDRTRNLAGGVDFNTGSFTHSFRAEYLKFVNIISDAVEGSNLPFANLGVEMNLSGTGLITGPSFLAPQSTIQSDRQIKYDGSKVWGSHILRYGVGYNRITGWAIANIWGLAPEVISEFLTAPGSLTCPGGQTGAGCPLNYLADIVLLGNGQGSFTDIPHFGKPNSGQGPDNRVGAYIGDSWKIRRNLTLNYGLRYVRDTGRTDSDLAPIAAINANFPGLGNRIKQPNLNFAPQLGVAWDPKGDGKTAIRAGIGLYYDNTIFNNILFDRLLRLPQGAFNVVQTPCAFGPAPITLGNTTTAAFIGGSSAAAAVICPEPNASFTASTGTPLGAVLPAGAGDCAGLTFVACAANFQTAVQSTYVGGGANANYIATAINSQAQIPTGLLDPNYKSPRSIQINIGLQRQLMPGMVLTVDYLRNVGLHYLIGQEINHTGDVNYFNAAAAGAAVNAVNNFYGCPSGPAGITCSIAAGASLANYAAAGLDSAYDLGSGACSAHTHLPDGTLLNNPCAFAGINPNVGSFYMYRPIGRSVYNGMDIKWVYNVKHPFTGVKYLNFQATYTLSRFVNAGTTNSGGGASGGDQDIVNNAINNRNALALMGPSALDRTHQFNFGGYADLPRGFRLGIISHFWSPLPMTPTVLPNPGSGQSGATAGIFLNDFLGSGQIGNPLPRSVDSSCGTVNGNCDYKLYDVGAYMRQIGPSGLINAISNYNATIAAGCGGGGCPTPAGQALINSSVLTLANLQALGAVAPAVSVPPSGQVPLAWLKGLDTQFSWVGHFWHERLTLTPSVGIFNTFNFANFDSPANVLIGQLNGSPGSINGTVNAGRPDRIGAGTGVFAFGAPRTIEWGLKAQF